MKRNLKDSAPIVIVKIIPEELRYKSDDEINSISDRLNKNLRISRSRRDFDSSKMIEKEISYIQREIKMRDNRKKAHIKFLSRK